MPDNYSDSKENVSSSIRTFPQLRECRRRLEANGTGQLSPAGWHRQVLSVAADLLSTGNSALQVNQDAIMVLLGSALSDTPGVPLPLDLAVSHTQGGVGRVWVGFAPEGEGDFLSAPDLVIPWSDPPPGKRVWVSLDAVPGEDVCDLVVAIAARQNSEPGTLLSIIGAGALLALLQTMDAMGAASNDVRASGYGNHDHRVDVLLTAQLGRKIVVNPLPEPPRT